MRTPLRLLLWKKSKDLSWTVKTDNVGTSNDDQFTIPTTSTGTYDCLIKWGDGTESKINDYDDAALTHTYPAAGTYNIEIVGLFYGIRFANTGDCLKLLVVNRWGKDFRLGNANGYFYGCANMTVPATDNLDITGTTTMASAFNGCSSMTTFHSINHVDTSNVTVMSFMFKGCSNFDQSLSNLNTSKVTTMRDMLNACSKFNHSLSYFNTAKVTTMQGMLYSCTVFDQSLASFNVGLITTAISMLSNVTLSTANYDALLISWAAQTVKANVPFTGGNATYSAGAATTAHDVLTDPPNSWSITDGGQTP